MAADIIKKCVEKKQCGAENKSSPIAYIKKILSNNVAIQFVPMEQQYLDKNFNLIAPQGVHELLSRTYQSPDSPQGIQEKLKPLFQDPTLIKIKSSSEGGSKTAQLFLIFLGEELKFILKGMKNPFEEVNNLRIIEESPLKKYFPENSPSSQNPYTPLIVMDAHNIMYAAPRGQSRYVSLIHAAQGKPVKKIIESYIQDHTQENIDVAKEALKKLGGAISTIHQENQANAQQVMGNTFTHGDFHPDNVFYNPKNKKITFIDNETFAHSIKKRQDPTVDIMKFYGTLVASFNSIHNYLSQAKKKGISIDLFYKDIVQSFVDGYINAYPPMKQQEVFHKLKTVMTKQGALETFQKNKISTFNPVKLQASQDKYMKKIFEDVEKEMNKSTH